MMGPSAIGAQPPPEDMDEEWLMMQEDEEGDEPFCNCTTGHGIEEADWNQCDSCGKPIYELEQEIAQEMMEYEEYMIRQAFANPLLPNNQSKEI